MHRPMSNYFDLSAVKAFRINLKIPGNCYVVPEMGDRLATLDMGRKKGAAVALPGELGPHLTLRPVPRSISVPIGILIHPAI